MSEIWRTVSIGDRVRVVGWPPELSEDTLHEDTIVFYRWLIATGSILEIVDIDEWGLPFGEIYSIVDGLEQYDTVALNHGCLELVAKNHQGIGNGSVG